MPPQFSIPPYALTALDRLTAAGYESWLVGGCVRDLLLGRTPGDYDICTAALPDETEAVFSGERLIETGLKHGTVTVILEGRPLEITTYRVDGGYTDARHPDRVTFTRSLREDAARRDFTVNAMAYHPGRGLWDGFGGQEDLNSRIIRCVGDPETRFREDGLRILRALRFASVLGFTLEPETEKAIRSTAHLLEKIAPERLSAELSKLLLGPGAGEILRAYPEVLGVLLPELPPMKGFDQRNIHHCYDLLGHTAAALDAAPADLTLRLTMLLHDIGKPDTFSIGEDGQGHFYGHAKRSVELADDILRRLRYPNRVRERVLTLIRYHDTPLAPEPKQVRRWLNRLGEETFLQLIEVHRADTLALAPAYRDRVRTLDETAALARSILAETPCLTLRDLAVDGHDLMALGLRGPALGRALNALLDRVLEGTLENRRETLLAAAKAEGRE